MPILVTDVPTLELAVRTIAGRCDGARARDDVGFNGPDAAFGRALARSPERCWDMSTKRMAWQMLRKYAGQLANAGIDFAAIPVPPDPATLDGRPSRAEVAAKVSRTVSAEGGCWVIRFRYDASLVAALHSEVDDAKWQPRAKAFTAPAHARGEVLAFAGRHGFTVLSDIAAPAPPPLPAVTALARPRTGARTISVEGDNFVIRWPVGRRGADPVLDAVRMLPARMFDAHNHCWRAPIVEALEPVMALAERHGFDVSAAMSGAVGEVIARRRRMLELSSAEDADIVINGLAPGMALRPYQRAGVAYICEAKRLIVGDDMGLGKLQPISEPILTPSGWSPIGLMKPGDQVMGRDGKPTEVVDVYPQGRKPIIKVTFSDGSWTRCGLEHLWAVQQVRNGTARHPDRWQVLTTQQLLDAGLRDRSGNLNWRIPMVEPVRYPTASLPIEPYLLGVVLGDGGISQDSVRLTTDRVLVDALGIAGRHREHASEGITEFTAAEPGLWESLCSLGLAGCRSWEKHLPDAYLRADADQRLALLQGLMDTDGYPMPAGGAEFSSTSANLVDAVAELTQSLGGVARGRRKAASTFTYKGQRRTGRPAERLNTKLPARLNPFRLERKASLYVAPTKYAPTRIIKTIEPDGDEEAVCIRVAAADHLYVTRSHIVTHNTAQSICSVVKASAFPCVIVCPASVKYNWKKEIEMWVPDAHVQVAGGGKRGQIGVGLWKPDWIVLNYDIVGTHRDEYEDKETGDVVPARTEGHLLDLAEIGMRSLVLDEFHAVKDPSTQRTHAITYLAGLVPDDGMILGLTGTPVENRAVELVPQLKILRRMEDLGGPGRFQERYCKNRDHLTELHARLRSLCFLRRLKTAVAKDIPGKSRALVPMQPDPKVMKEYQRAEADVVRYLHQWALEKALAAGATDDEAKAAAMEKALRAEAAKHLVMINTLKTLIARAKLPAVLAWVQTFLDGSDEKLIVFAEHTEVVDAIADRFGGMKVQGGQHALERQRIVERFQSDPAARVIALQMKAGGLGITLTAACNVAFVEQGWTPTGHDQCEDRSFRIGQTRPVLCHYLLCDRTIDDDIAELIADKRLLVDAITDGKASDEANVSVLGELLVRLAARAEQPVGN